MTARPALNRAQVLDDRSLVGVALSRAWTAHIDQWLRDVFRSCVDAQSGLALVAVGGYGRGELSPASDLDLLLLHHPATEVDAIAEQVFYPIWDEGLKLGHAVRTVDQAIELARDDLDTATGLLDARWIAGDEALAAELETAADQNWRTRSKRHLARLRERLAEMYAARGEVAFLLEPDLKESKGGLRDVHALRWLDRAVETTMPADRTTLAIAASQLLGARVELHRHMGRAGDVLLLQEQDAVAEALGTDADALMATIANAGRHVSFISEDTWRRAFQRSVRGFRGRRRQDVEAGIFVRDGTLQIDVETADLRDPVLPLRFAYESAHHDLPMRRKSLDVLGEHAAPMPDRWPDEARELLVGLLEQEDRGIMAIEALEHHSLFSNMLPEWRPCRSKPQRNAYHRFTVDRHLLEAASNAARLRDRVERHDLLVIGALLHDIGKGYPGDHTEVGMELIDRIGPRLGYSASDTQVLRELIRLHLLLPDVATRRDLDDIGTIRSTANEVRDISLLHLLHGLTEADSEATGPSAWGPWKAQLVAELVERTEEYLGGTYAPIRESGIPTTRHRELMRGPAPTYEGTGTELTIATLDRPGGLSRIAGVLSLHGLNVLDATAYSDEAPLGLSVWKVVNRFEGEIDWERVTADVERALNGRLALQARLGDRIRTYGSSPVRSAGGERRDVSFDNETSDVATVLQVLAPDRIGLLYRITGALAELDLDMRRAKIQTLGDEVVDSFYVLDVTGAKVTDPDYLAEIERAVLAAIDGP